jgi:uncharacterized protein (TIGR00255 family)
VQRQSNEEAIFTGFKTALGSLTEMRRSEGAALAEVVAARLDQISRPHPESPTERKPSARNLAQALAANGYGVAGASPALPEDRLAMEAALLIQRSDATEELDRLEAHAQAVRDLLAEGGPIGRRLDFLCQELNREANTLCSKSSDLELTRLGLALKAAVEQLREQVQNIE